MARLCATFILLLSPSVLAMKCFSSLNFPEVRACKAVADAGNARNHKEGIADILLNVADIGINIVQTLTNSKFIDEIVDNIFRTTSINIRSREVNRPWVNHVLDMLNFGDVSHHCWITYNRKTKATIDRGCGTEGAVEQIGTKVASSFQAWLKGDPLHALAGGDICFAPDLLGNGDEEMCLCKTDGCNKNHATAKASLGLHQTAESITCGDKDCPVMDLSKVIGGEWKGFNTACYTKENLVDTKDIKVDANQLGELRSEEHCFSTEGIYDEEAVTAARMTAKNDDSVVGARFGKFTFTKQSETPASLNSYGKAPSLPSSVSGGCQAECQDPGTGAWCCEACEGVACSGAGGQDGGLGVRSALGDGSAPENGATERGFLAIWTLLANSLFSVVLL